VTVRHDGVILYISHPCLAFVCFSLWCAQRLSHASLTEPEFGSVDESPFQSETVGYHVRDERGEPLELSARMQERAHADTLRAVL
jgi:hypothetical protein